MRRTVSLLLLASLAACAGESDAPSSAPTATVTAASASTSTTVTAASAPTSTTAAAGVILPEGFERVRATVTEPDGTVCELCLWLADTVERRRSGLMFVTDLGDADGMAFVYPDPHTGSFWMKNTLLPLSIAFFSPSGEYLDAFDMEPCGGEPCRRYPTPAGFLVAIETTQGDLPQLGIVPGSVLDLTDLPCGSAVRDVTAG